MSVLYLLAILMCMCIWLKTLSACPCRTFIKNWMSTSHCCQRVTWWRLCSLIKCILCSDQCCLGFPPLRAKVWKEGCADVIQEPASASSSLLLWRYITLNKTAVTQRRWESIKANIALKLHCEVFLCRFRCFLYLVATTDPNANTVLTWITMLVVPGSQVWLAEPKPEGPGRWGGYGSSLKEWSTRWECQYSWLGVWKSDSGFMEHPFTHGPT